MGTSLIETFLLCKYIDLIPKLLRKVSRRTASKPRGLIGARGACIKSIQAPLAPIGTAGAFTSLCRPTFSKQLGYKPIYKKLFTFPPTFILRHRRKEPEKVQPAWPRKAGRYPLFHLPKAKTSRLLKGYILLAIDALPYRSRSRTGPPPTRRHFALRELMQRQLACPLEIRSIPDGFSHRLSQKAQGRPAASATVEALFIHALLGRNTEGLLDGYHWSKQFFELNEKAFRARGYNLIP